MLSSLLDKEFKKCLKKFPELKNVELIIEECQELAGAEGWFEYKRVVVLFIPEALKNKPECLIPIIYHELSHIISKGSEECDKIFNERADEKSKELWRKLKEVKALNCEDLRR